MSDGARRGVLPFVIALGGHRDLRAEDVPGLDEGSDTRGRALVQELGIEALAENADWVRLHRDRPVTVPGAK